MLGPVGSFNTNTRTHDTPQLSLSTLFGLGLERNSFSLGLDGEAEKRSLCCAFSPKREPKYTIGSVCVCVNANQP